MRENIICEIKFSQFLFSQIIFLFLDLNDIGLGNISIYCQYWEIEVVQ